MSVEQFRAGKRLWSAEDDARLRTLYPDKPTAVVAVELRRTLHATYQRAILLGLKKSAAYLESPHACRLRRGDHVGAASRFQAGHVPANKGLRRPGWGPGRMKTTQFQAGKLNGVAAQRYKPVGSTRLIGGYLYRKVSDVSGVTWTVNWKLEHLLIWTRAHGPVPAGHAIGFKNGNRADVRLDNLECVTRQSLMARNSVHNLPQPLAQTIHLLGALKRQIRRREHANQHD